MKKQLALFLFLFPFTLLAAEKNASTNTIPAVIVKAKREANLSAGPQTTITREQLMKTGTPSLAQALQNLGGVQLQDTTGNGSQIALGLRGFGANASTNTLLLVNDIPLTQPDLAPPNLNVIPLHEIELIEVISGSESVLYGDQAVGGVVNILTQKKRGEIVNLACGAGSYNQYDCYAGLYHHYRNLKYNLLLYTNHTENYRDHNDYDQNRLSGMLAYVYQTGRLQLDYAIGNEDMQYPGALSSTQVSEDRRQASNDINFFKNANGYLHLKQTQDLSERLQFETNLMYRKMDGHGVLSSRFTQGRITEYLHPVLKAKIRNARVRGGLEWQQDHYNLNSLLGDTIARQQKYSAFALANLPLTSQLALVLGARAAQQNSRLSSLSVNHNINRAVASTLGITYQISPTLQTYLRRAGSFRFPKADENASTPPGSTGLRTQRGISYETGLEWMQEKWLGKANIYQLNLRDEITFDPTQTPQDPFGTNRNLSPTVRRGLSLSARKEWQMGLSLDGQYNYASAIFQHGPQAGNRIPLVSEQIARAGLNYHLTRHWNVYAESVFTGSQFPANDDANISGKMGGYTLYHFHLRYSDKHLAISFRINNIFNKLYYFYKTLDLSSQNEFFYPAPERNFSIHVNYLFG